MRLRSGSLFQTARTEGGLLPADLLQRVADNDGQLDGLKPSDYHLAPGERLNEAITRSWTRLLGAWRSFDEARGQLAPGDRGGRLTRERWLHVLFDELGYGRLVQQPAIEIEAKSFPVFSQWQHTPVHLVGCGVKVDTRTPGVAGAAGQSPHSLLQELLNRSPERLWGIVSNGLVLRVLRDNVALTRQAYLEFDLEGMFSGEVYPDFVLLWLVCHQSRVEAERPEDCWLERWTQDAAEHGTRALDALRDGVQEAIEILGAGFLAHPANHELHADLRAGTLEPQDYYRQLLRLVYRLLFVFVAEDRDALLDPAADKIARERYSAHFSTQRLRSLAQRRRGGRQHDRYEQLKLVMAALHSDGCPPLGLPALGSYLWSPDAIAGLTDAVIANEHLLDAIRALSTVEERGVSRAVDFRNLGAEELGSIYESLLELHPELNRDAASFSLNTAAGHERKTTGSYYTPTSLISTLLDSALEPVLENAVASHDPEAALLDLKVCDPACGSGHFLIAAANRIAKRVASIRTGDPEPSPDGLRNAVRDVIGRCVFGVDANPMAVELCKVSLWLEALEPGKPLGFLDARIRLGNSLLGVTFAGIEAGIPDDAYKPITGDERRIASEWKRQNASEREGQMTLEDLTGALVHELGPRLTELEQASDDTVLDVYGKERTFSTIVGSEPFKRAKQAADAWCGAFVQLKAAAGPRITSGMVRRIAAGTGGDAASADAIRGLAERFRFFHWEIEFPQIFGAGRDGFDLVLGNPPWERVKFDEREYLARDYPDIALVASANRRRDLVASLTGADPEFLEGYREAERRAFAESHFLRHSTLYPLTGRGRDINTYAVFCELSARVQGSLGRVGLIVPSGIATDEATSHFFRYVVRQNYLESLFDFENRLGIFPAVDSRVKFCLLTLSGAPIGADPVFVFFAHRVDDIQQHGRRFSLSAHEFRLLNPATRTCPVFRSKRDADLVLRIYERAPVLLDEETQQSPWNIRTRPGLFSMGNDAALFADAADGDRVPLMEAKLAHMFDHRWATYDAGRIRDVTDAEKADPCFMVRPRYYVPAAEMDRRTDPSRHWFIGWRKIARATDERTLIPLLLPRAAIGDNIVLVESDVEGGLDLFLPSLLGNFVVDYVCRNKLGGSTLQTYVGKQLPVLPPSALLAPVDWAGSRLVDWLAPRVAELTFTTNDLQQVAGVLACSRTPYRWNTERRARLRAELDAAFFHLYGLGREDAEYVLETFPIVRRNDERRYGDFRTKHLILAAYDHMEKARATGNEYTSALEPLPAGTRERP